MLLLTSQDIVIKVVNGISTNNPVIHSDLVEALAQIPAEISANALPFVHKWLKNEYIPAFSRLPEAVIHLILNYMKNIKISLGIELLDDLLQPIII